MFHPVPLTVELVLHGDHEGDPRITVLHYRRSPVAPTPTVSDLQAMTAWAVVHVLQPLQACVSSSTRWNEISATDIDHENGARYVRTLDPILTGARAGEVLPGNVNVALAKHTTSHTPDGRGRLFVPDIIEADQNNAIIIQALVNLLLNLGAALLEAAVAGDGVEAYNLVPVVASKKHVRSANITGISFDTITDSLRPRLKYHRRRRRRQPAPVAPTN